MLKSIITILALLCFNIQGLAQDQQKLDSLFKLIRLNTNDTTQLYVNKTIASLYKGNNQTKAISYFEKARDIALKLNRKTDLAVLYNAIGSCYFRKNDMEKALENYLISVRYAEQIQNNQSSTDAYISIISVYAELRDFSKAHMYMSKAEQALNHSKDSMQLMSLYTKFGFVYSRENKRDSAFYYIKKSLEIAKAMHNTRLQITSYSNLGLEYKKNNQTDFALLYFDSTLHLIQQEDDQLCDLAMVFNNIGSTYVLKKDYKAARSYFLKSLENANEAGFFNASLENYRNLADMFAAMGRHKEYAFYLEKYYTLRDSSINNETKNLMLQLETDYIVEKKDNELLKKDVSIHQQKNQLHLFIMLSISFLILLSAAIYFNRKIQQKKKEVELQNKFIQEQKEHLHNLNQVKDTLFSVISHDLRNPLNTLQTYLMLSENNSIPENKRLEYKNQSMQSIAQTGNLLDNLLTWANMQLRDTAPILTPINILDVIQEVVDILKPQANQKNIFVDIRIDDIRVISDSNILSIALRNIITNAIKFSSNNKKITILGEPSENLFKITIQDEGIGMNATQIESILQVNQSQSSTGTAGERGTGLGLYLVVQLLNKINVPLEIISKVGEGSSFILRLSRNISKS